MIENIMFLMIVGNQFQSLISTKKPMIENVMFFDDWDINYFPMFCYVEKTNDQKYQYPDDCN